MIGELLDYLGSAKFYSQLDLTKKYHWMRIQGGDKWKKIFQMRYSYFEYQVITFGFLNISASFQGYVNKILTEKLDVYIIIYLNNILIYMKHARYNNVEAVRWVIGELQKHGLFSNLKKCHLYQVEVCFLGYVISSQKICMDEKELTPSKLSLNQNL